MSKGTARSSGRKKPWGGENPSPSEAHRRLLDAAEECLEKDGLDAFGIKSVAQCANVGRPTVYRYFENRDALLTATLLRRGERREREIAKEIAQMSNASEMALHVTMAILEDMRGDPSYRDHVEGKVGGPRLDTRLMSLWVNTEVLSRARQWYAPLIEAAGWSDSDFAESIETITRFARSLVLFPVPERSRLQTRAYLIRRLLPALMLPPPPDDEDQARSRSGS